MPTDEIQVDLLDIERLEEADRSEDGYNETPPSDIVAYNELRSCADLYRMTSEGSLEIDPNFQRDFIWKGPDQTRFIDSLVKQLPVPSMCFAFDFKQNIWIVIDGLQRISTIIRFLSGQNWKLAALDDIDPQLRGKNAATLKNARAGENKVLFNRVQNQALPVNVIRCDLTKRTHNEYIYTIFHRLNSGGLKLNNQEIRNCIYSDPFNSLLRELDLTQKWRRLNHMKEDQNYRFTKQETILRFFAFLENRDAYKGSMSKFLNDYMFDKRNISEQEIDLKRNIFLIVCNVISDNILADDPPPRLPATVLEALMVGIAENTENVLAKSKKDLVDLFTELRAHQSLSADYLSEGLSKPDRVDGRLQAAINVFSK